MTDNIYLQKSNILIRSFTNESLGVMSQRIFNFLIKTQQEKNWTDLELENEVIGFYLADFCKYYDINKTNMFEKVKFKNEKITLIKKEIKILTQLQFYFEIKKENNLINKFKFVNLFYRGDYDNGYVYFEVNKELINENFVDLKRDYTNIFLPYTKLVKSKYSLRLYEYLRSFLFFNHKSKKQAQWNHIWTFEYLAKILNLSITSSYFKIITKLKNQILEFVKKDLAQTDILFDYELIKGRKKYEKILITTKLNLTKWKIQKSALINVSKQSNIFYYYNQPHEQ